jgi:hypothetical protein
MPECTVCKGYYQPGQPCERCRSDNTEWDNWRAAHAEEQGGIEGLLAFYRPYRYLPLLVALLAIPLGLMGVGGLWRGIAPAAQFLLVAVPIGLCPSIAFAVYSARHDIREQGLLNRVRRGNQVLLNDYQLRAMLAPALLLISVLLVAYALVASDTLWELSQWLFLDPAYQEQVEREQISDDADPSQELGSLRDRVTQVLPLVLAVSHVALLVSLAYTTSLSPALEYARGMNTALPPPIFLQGNRMAEMVRAQAEEQLHRQAGFVVQTARTIDRGTGVVRGTMLGMFNRLLPAPGSSGRDERQTAHLEREQEQTIRSGNWNWEELDRTQDGGIIMKASGIQYTQAPATPAGPDKQGWLRMVYTVVADPWGHIVKITRVAEEE